LEPEGSSPYSQVPATCPYPEPTPLDVYKYISNTIAALTAQKLGVNLMKILRATYTSCDNLIPGMAL